MNGIDRFDPDAFIRSEGPYEGQPKPVLSGMPVEWQRGMARLMELPPPVMASPARWKQIQKDAERFMLSWHQQSAALGWSTACLFGFEWDAPGGDTGLIIALQGDRVVALDRDVAAIKTENGHRWYNRHWVAENARPIWTIGQRR